MITPDCPGICRLLLLWLLVLVLVGCGGQTSFSADEHISRAQQAHAQGDLRTAVIEIKNALQQEPSRVEARRLLGLYSLEGGDAVGAESELVRALELDDDPAMIRLPLARARLMQGKTDEVLAATAPGNDFAEQEWPEALALRGQALLARGELSAARAALEEVLSLEPDRAEALLGMAWIELLSGQAEQARPWVDQALASDPKFDRARELLGDLEREAGQLEAAEAAYNKAIETTRQPFNPRFKRALTRIDRADFEGAEEDIQSLQKAFGQQAAISYARGLIAFHQQRYADARTAFEDALSRDPEHGLATFFLGATHFALGNRNQAENHLQRTASRYPDFAPAHRLLAMLRRQEGDTARAENALKAILQRNPDDQATLTLLSGLYLDQGRTDEALRNLRHVVDLHPDSATTRAQLSMVLMQQGQREESLRELEAAIALDSPERPRLEVMLVLQHLQANEFRQALEAAERLRGRSDLDSAMVSNLIGLSQIGLNNPDAAATTFREGLAVRPGDPSLAMNLGVLELRRGNRPAAIDAFEALQAENPGHPQSAMRLAELAMQRNDTTRARRWLSDALERHPEMAELHYQLAGVLATSQAYQEAEQSLRRALEIDPDHVPARVALVRRLSFTGNVDEARTLFAPLAEAHGERPDVLAQQGWFAMQAGNFEDAIRNYAQALEGDSRRVWVMEYHQALLGAGRSDDTVANLSNWLEGQPGDSAARHLLGTTLLAAGREADALAVYRDQLDRQAEDVVALNNLAWLLREQDTAQALAYAQKARDLAPQQPAVLDTLGVVFLYNGDVDRAVNTLEQAHALAPNAPSIGFNLARGLQTKGRQDEARALLRELLDRHEEFPEREQAEALLRELEDG